MLAGCEPGADVLCRAAAKCAPADARGMISNVLALRTPGDVQAFFARTRRSRKSQEAAAAVYALHALSAKRLGRKIYAAALNELLAAAVNLAEEPWAAPLAGQYCALADEALYATAGDLDPQRFAMDTGYQASVLDRLAQQGDAAGLETALSLARRHGLNVWPVYMAHLEHTLGQGDIAGVAPAVQCVRAGVMQRPLEVVERVTKLLADDVAGTDLARRAACTRILAEALAAAGDEAAAHHNGVAWIA